MQVVFYCGAGDRARTGTGKLPRDFKSRASANSATPACGLVYCTTESRLCQSVWGKFYKMPLVFRLDHQRRIGIYLTLARIDLFGFQNQNQQQRHKRQPYATENDQQYFR